MDDRIRIPVDVDYSEGLAGLGRFSSKAKDIISGISPSGKSSRDGDINIRVNVDPTQGVASLVKFNSVQQQTATGLQKTSKASEQASFSLLNLGRVAQDAPYGFIGIANNLNPLLESFQRLKATTGTSGGALKALAGQLIGPAGLGFALSAVTAIISFASIGFSAWNRGMHSSSEAVSELSQSLAGSKDEYVNAVKQVSALRSEIDLAKKGFIDKSKVVKEYNESIGKTTGFVKSLDEAEAALAKNANAYIQFTLLKAAANFALGKAAEEAFKVQEEINNATRGNTGKNLQISAGFTASQAQEAARLAGKTGAEQAKAYTDAFNNAIAEGKASKNIALQAKFQKIGEDLFQQAGALAKQFGFDFYGDDKLKGDKDRFNSIITKAKEIAAFLKDRYYEVNYEFNPQDDKATALKKAQKFLDDVSKGLKVSPRISPDSFSEPAIQKEYKDPVDPLIEKFKELNRISSKPIDLNFKEDPSIDKAYFEHEINAIQDRAKRLRLNLSVRLNPEIDQDAYGAALEKSLINLNLQFADTISAFENNLAAAIGEGIGEGLASGNFSELFTGIFQILGTAMQDLGKTLIATAIGLEAIKKAFKTLNPAVALTAGIGLIALGSIIKSRVAKSTPFAYGGLVSGRTFAEIGEGRGTGKNNPEVVAPLDRLKSFFHNQIADALNGKSGGASIGALQSSNINIPDQVELRFDGRDMVGTLVINQQKQYRNG